jgi:hypothetical protein
MRFIPPDHHPGIYDEEIKEFATMVELIFYPQYNQDIPKGWNVSPGFKYPAIILNAYDDVLSVAFKNDKNQTIQTIVPYKGDYVKVLPVLTWQQKQDILRGRINATTHVLSKQSLSYDPNDWFDVVKSQTMPWLRDTDRSFFRKWAIEGRLVEMVDRNCIIAALKQFDIFDDSDEPKDSIKLDKIGGKHHTYHVKCKTLFWNEYGFVCTIGGEK